AANREGPLDLCQELLGESLLIGRTESTPQRLLRRRHRTGDDLSEQLLAGRLELLSQEHAGVALHLLTTRADLRQHALALRLGLLPHLAAHSLDLLIDA